MTFFGRDPSPSEIRVSVLEQKLQTFDEISKQMLTKLEQAVDKISESNANISQILIRHEERIDRGAEANNTIIQLINKTEREIKQEVKEGESALWGRVRDNEKSIDELKKTRWVWVGALVAASFFFSQLRVVDRIFPHPNGKPPHHEYTLLKL